MEVEDITEPALGYEESSRSITAGAKVSWDLRELSTEIVQFFELSSKKLCT